LKKTGFIKEHVWKYPLDYSLFLMLGTPGPHVGEWWWWWWWWWWWRWWWWCSEKDWSSLQTKHDKL